MQVPKEFDENILHQLLLAMISFFRRHYKMNWFLFCWIMQDVCATCSYFLKKSYASKVVLLSSIKKCMSPMKMLAYGLVANACDEKHKIEENTTIKCLLWFVKAIQDLFESEYVKQLLYRWRWMDVKVYKACLFHWIVCIIVETISLLLAKGIH